MNGMLIESQISLRDTSAADAVIVGSGTMTQEIVKDAALMAEVRLDPSRQFLRCRAPNIKLKFKSHGATLL
jgi:hypothetical protein